MSVQQADMVADIARATLPEGSFSETTTALFELFVAPLGGATRLALNRDRRWHGDKFTRCMPEQMTIDGNCHRVRCIR